MVASMLFSGLSVAAASSTTPFTIRSSVGWYKTRCSQDHTFAKSPCNFKEDFEDRTINDSVFRCEKGTLLEEKDTSGDNLSDWITYPIKGTNKVFFSPNKGETVYEGMGAPNYQFMADLLDESGLFFGIRICTPRSLMQVLQRYSDDDDGTCRVSGEYQTSTDCPDSCFQRVDSDCPEEKKGECVQCALNVKDENCVQDERCIPAKSKYVPHDSDGTGVLEVEGKCVAGSTGNNLSLVTCDNSDTLQQWTFSPVSAESLV